MKCSALVLFLCVLSWHNCLVSCQGPKPLGGAGGGPRGGSDRQGGSGLLDGFTPRQPSAPSGGSGGVFELLFPSGPPNTLNGGSSALEGDGPLTGGSLDSTGLVGGGGAVEPLGLVGPKDPMLPKPGDQLKAHPLRPAPFRDTLEKECPAQQRIGLPAICEIGVAARVLQVALLKRDIEGTAEVFVESESVDGIAEGLRIPEGAEPLPLGVRPQEGDPDVIAVKSVALAILQAAEDDEGLIGKLINAVVVSAHPREEEDSDDDDDIEDTNIEDTGNGDDNGSSGLSIGNKVCRPGVKVVIVNDDVEIEEASICKISGGKDLVDREELRETLENRELMQEVLDADPDTDDRRRLMQSASRSLQVAGGVIADSYYCTRCWPKKACKPFYWCKSKKDKNNKNGKKGKKKGKKNKTSG